MYIHPTADVAESAEIGEDTRIWHDVQIRGGVRIGRECILGKGAYLDEHVLVGDRVKIQNRVSIYKYCVIEDGVFIGPHVCFTNDRLPRAINPDGSLKSPDDWDAGRTVVQRGASIGAGSVILPSLNIGRFALVGAGAVVTRDVADYGLVVGNPARLVGYACVCGHRIELSGAEGRCLACDRRYLQDASGSIRPENEPGR